MSTSTRHAHLALLLGSALALLPACGPEASASGSRQAPAPLAPPPGETATPLAAPDDPPLSDAPKLHAIWREGDTRVDLHLSEEARRDGGTARFAVLTLSAPDGTSAAVSGWVASPGAEPLVLGLGPAAVRVAPIDGGTWSQVATDADLARTSGVEPR